MKDEELILRYFAFRLRGLATYRTPQKFWLNDTANEYKKLDDVVADNLATEWKNGVRNAVAIFGNQAFRRASDGLRSQPINKALVDLNMLTLSHTNFENALAIAPDYRQAELDLLNNDEFDDLISRAVDHVSRTKRRFAMWNESMAAFGLSAS